MSRLKEVIHEYIDGLFKDLDSIIGFNEEFMKQDAIFELPDIDYIRLDKFISSSINTLSKKDTRIKDEVFRKMEKELNALIDYYHNFVRQYDQKAENQAHVMIKHHMEFLNYTESNAGTSLGGEKADEIKKEAERLFVPYFEEQYSTKIKKLKDIISFKYFLLDKLFWQHVNASQILHQYFSEVGLKGPYSLKIFMTNYIRKLDISVVKDKEYIDFLLHSLKKM
jgi:hypothetical protein